jgi:hypothetical protein
MSRKQVACDVCAGEFMPARTGVKRCPDCSREVGEARKFFAAAAEDIYVATIVATIKGSSLRAPSQLRSVGITNAKGVLAVVAQMAPQAVENMVKQVAKQFPLTVEVPLFYGVNGKPIIIAQASASASTPVAPQAEEEVVA